MQSAGVSWKIYYTDTLPNGQPLTDLGQFWPNFAAQHSANIVPVSQYFTDLANNTLPQVSFIQAGLASGRDEHPGGQTTTGEGGNDIQKGALYVSSLVQWIDEQFVVDEFRFHSQLRRRRWILRPCAAASGSSARRHQAVGSHPAMIPSSSRRLISIRLVSVCR